MAGSSQRHPWDVELVMSRQGTKGLVDVAREGRLHRMDGDYSSESPRVHRRVFSRVADHHGRFFCLPLIV